MLPGFAELGLSDHLLRALQKAEYVVPTPIQSQAIPHVLKGKDLLGSAQTGTGKTAAFALPILQNIMRKGRSKGRSEIQALVIAPTRELAAQIGENFQKYAGPNGPRQTVVFGGVSKHSQIQILRRGVEVLVATPGRLLDLMGQGEIKLDSVDTFVLDEADRMLDMGFIHDVRRITKALPKGRQTLLFSATMPKEI
ncbi:DEAD/DEAH box helicase, partial [Myxococcota bacterium]|nr:DEAD/DEAH box helicase [Myxococcota bacterium]